MDLENLPSLRRIWNRVVFFLLMVHSAYGLFEAGRFMILEYPRLNRLLKTGQINADQVNMVVADAIVLAFITLVGIVMAIRVNKEDEGLIHTIDLIVATLLLITSSALSEYFLQFNLLNSFIFRFLTLGV